MTPQQFAKACDLFRQIEEMDKRLETFNNSEVHVVSCDDHGRVKERLSDRLGMDEDYLCGIVSKAIREDIEMSKDALWEQIRELGIDIQRENYRSANLKLIS